MLNGKERRKKKLKSEKKEQVTKKKEESIERNEKAAKRKEEAAKKSAKKLQCKNGPVLLRQVLLKGIVM